MKMTQGSWTFNSGVSQQSSSPWTFNAGVSQQSSSGGWTKEASNTKDEHLKINKLIN